MARGSNQYTTPPPHPPPPISEVIVTEPSNVCIRTIPHECILAICTSHAALSETRANQVTPLNLSLVVSYIWKKYIETTKNQISHRSKASGVNYSPNKSTWLCSKTSLYGFARLHFFAIPLCCWKNTPLKTRVSWYGMVFQCIVTIFLSSDSCLASCPKLTFLNTVWEAVSFVDVTKQRKKKVVCSTIFRGHVKAFRHSLLVDHSSPPSPAHQVNGPGGIEGQACPG